MPVLLRSATSLIVLLALSGCGRNSTESPPFDAPSAASESPSVTGNEQKCPAEDHGSLPTWVPADLPLPAGTYFTKPIASQGGYSQGLFVVPLSTSDFAKFVLDSWPKAGYHLGTGDAEVGEAEDQFAKGSGIGAFKVQDRYCKPISSTMLLIWAEDRSKVGTPGTEGGSPLPDAGESPSP
jgi:predicted small lipoprotein YifL